ncbi:polysaccharide deacetylase [Halopseudomonas bauzanensis]|nr:polysaccharide deacetylase [Halopseudomonas bauzanensis]
MRRLPGRWPAARLLMAAWLTLMLAACGDSDEPEVAASAEPPAVEVAEPGAAVIQHDDAYYDELRARWFALEHAERSAAASPGSHNADPEQAPLSAEPEPVSELPVAVLEPESMPAIGIIIDDLGHSLSRGRRIIALPAPVTLAILPHTQAAQLLASEAAVAGKTVILHQPMENGAALAIGPGGLYADMDRAKLEQTLQANLNNFVPIQGVNNHMGSRLTSDRQAMDWVMQVLAARGLFFIDSRTSAATQAAFAAEAAGVRHLSRDVFLDNERTFEAIDAAFQHALTLARKQGSALIIGHPYPQTLEYLEQRLPELQREKGVKVVSLEALLARKYQN